MERRTYTEKVEIREVGNDLVATGLGVVYGRRSKNLGGFVEEVRYGAGRKTIQEQDVVALANHDPNLILGRRSARTLVLEETEQGIPYEIVLPNTTVGRDWAELLKRGDVIGSSFGFRTITDEWGLTDDGFPLRTLTEFAMRDIGPVTFPAYDDTTAGLRSLAETRSLDPETVVRAAQEGKLAAVILGEIDPDEGRSEAAESTSSWRPRRVF